MNRRRVRLSRVVAGVVIAGAAGGAILWWNYASPNWSLKSAQASPPSAPPTTTTPPTPNTSATALATNDPSPHSPAGGSASAGPGSAPSPTTLPLITIVPPPTTKPTTLPATPTTSAPHTPPGGLTPVFPPAPSAITPSSPAALVQGKALKDAGKLLEARKALNDALVSNTLSASGDVAAAKALLREIHAVTLFSPETVPGDEWVEVRTIKSGDRLARIANEHFVPYEMLLRINGLTDDRRIRAGQKFKVLRGPFHAVVSKSHFTMDIYLGAPGGPGSMYVTTYRVGLGADDSTPEGLWVVARGNKLKNPTYFSPRGEGVIAADDPANPLGEFWIGITGLEGEAVGRTSYGIHGTIEPQTIGTMSSMGCIRLAHDDIAAVFITLYEVKSLVRVVE